MNGWKKLINAVTLIILLVLCCSCSDQKVIISGMLTNIDEVKKIPEIDWGNNHLQLVKMEGSGVPMQIRIDERKTVLKSSLPKIKIPEDGVLAFNVKKLPPGKYTIACQHRAFSETAAAMPPEIVKNDKTYYFEIPENAQFPIKIDVGKVELRL